MCMLELFMDFLVTWEDSCSLTITAAVLVRSPEALLFVTSTPLRFLTRFPAFHGQEEGPGHGQDLGSTDDGEVRTEMGRQV